MSYTNKCEVISAELAAGDIVSADAARDYAIGTCFDCAWRLDSASDYYVRIGSDIDIKFREIDLINVKSRLRDFEPLVDAAQSALNESLTVRAAGSNPLLVGAEQ